MHPVAYFSLRLYNEEQLCKGEDEEEYLRRRSEERMTHGLEGHLSEHAEKVASEPERPELNGRCFHLLIKK
jgi:hypothetical protein